MGASAPAAPRQKTYSAQSGYVYQYFYKGYRDGDDLNGNPHRVPDQALYDLQLGYTGIRNLKLALGVRNLFDKDPPLVPGGDVSWVWPAQPACTSAKR